MIMENNYTQYSDELKETDPTSPFYTEIRKMELRIYALEESKRKSETVTKVLQKSKTKLEELKSKQKKRELSLKFRIKMDMINQNPFCVLGISPMASEREIQKQVTKTIRYAEVGKQISFDTDFSFTEGLKRDKESISIASSAIEQPLNRLLHSLF